MLKAKLIERGIPELGPIVTVNGFQAVGMFIVQPQSQALKVLKHFILALQEENSRVTRVVVNNDKDVPLASHGANMIGTDSVHIEYLSRLLSHHGINQRMESSDHLAMMTMSTNEVTLKLEQGQSSE
jgi:tRNA(Glu) U13 pseudouridine synthase TruD